MISYSVKGDYDKTNKFFQRALEVIKSSNLDKYGKKGVDALRSATPRDTGKTAESWTYEIVHEDGRATIYWKNTNVVDYVNIAVILQYGHATKNGSWVEGRDYINPALRPVFDEIAEKAWSELNK